MLFLWRIVIGADQLQRYVRAWRAADHADDVGCSGAGLDLCGGEKRRRSSARWKGCVVTGQRGEGRRESAVRDGESLLLKSTALIISPIFSCNRACVGISIMFRRLRSKNGLERIGSPLNS